MNLLLRSKIYIVFSLLLFSSSAYSQQVNSFIVQPEKSETYLFLIDYRKGFALSLLDKNKNLEWQIPSPGMPLGMGMSGNNVVVIYAEVYKFRQPMKVVHAMLVDTYHRKILKDEIIYTNPGKLQIQVEVLQDPVGNLSCVLVRESTEKEPIFTAFGNTANVEKSKTLTMIRLGNNLVSQTKELNSIALESVYFLSHAGSNNEVYVCSRTKKEITTERFDSNGNKMGQLSFAIAYRQNYLYTPIAQYDTILPDCFYLALDYSDDKKDNLTSVFKFDFKEKKPSMTEQIENNKDYLETLKAANPYSKFSHFPFIKFLRPVQIINTQDKTICIKEIHTLSTNGNAQAIMRQGAVISIYSKDLRLIKDISINKKTIFSSSSDNQIHGYAKDGKLYVVTNETNGRNYEPVLYTFSLTDFSMISRVIPDPKPGNTWIVFPDDILWYKNSFLVPFYNTKGSVNDNLNWAWTTENY